MMAVMTAQPPLALAPDGALPVGAAAAIVEDGEGGRVFVHGNLAYAWDAGDAPARRFAAVSLMRIKAATQRDVATAFAVKPATVRRWESRLTDAGVAGLLAERKGPKRKSKLTADAIARIRRLREGGASYRAIATETGVSEGSVRNALILDEAGAEDDCGATTSGTQSEPGPEPEPGHGHGHGLKHGLKHGLEHGLEPEWDVEPGPEWDVEAGPEVEVENGCSATGGEDPPVPVLADPIDRAAERVLARFGVIGYAPPVFTPCARAPLAGLLLALPALAATGLLECAHSVYGELPSGFYSLDTMLCEAVLRALIGEARAEGAARIDPPALGRVLGLDRAPEVKTIRRKIRYLAEAGRAGDWIAAMATRHVAEAPEQAAVLYSTGTYAPTRAPARSPKPMCRG